MNSTRTATVAAISCVVLWSAKALAIAVAGGLGKSPAEGPLFLLGLVACVVAALALGVAVARGQSLLRRVGAAIVSFVVIAVLGSLAQLVISAFQPTHPGWVWGELNLWFLALLVAGLAGLVRARETHTPVGSEPALAAR